jgi:hypothetical protein
MLARRVSQKWVRLEVTAAEAVIFVLGAVRVDVGGAAAAVTGVLQGQNGTASSETG